MHVWFSGNLLTLLFVVCGFVFAEDVKRLNEKLTDSNKVKMELQLKLDEIQSSAASVQVRYTHTHTPQQVHLTLNTPNKLHNKQVRSIILHTNRCFALISVSDVCLNCGLPRTAAALARRAWSRLARA